MTSGAASVTPHLIRYMAGAGSSSVPPQVLEKARHHVPMILGYDIGSRTTKALGREAMRARNHLPFSIGGTLGTAAAAGSIARLGEEEIRHLLSCGAQQASGVMTYARDTEHIEKAFIFGGMHAMTFKGRSENPLTTDEVHEKAEELLDPVLGKSRTRQLIEAIDKLETLGSMRDLRPLLKT